MSIHLVLTNPYFRLPVEYGQNIFASVLRRFGPPNVQSLKVDIRKLAGRGQNEKELWLLLNDMDGQKGNREKNGTGHGP